MAQFLFISPTEIKQSTVVGGGVDDDKFVFVISDVMNTTILPLLGQELYDVILAGADAGNRSDCPSPGPVSGRSPPVLSAK